MTSTGFLSAEAEARYCATLARFRADPRRVRVSIARDPKGWRAKVTARDGEGPTFTRSAKTSRMATILALQAAESTVPGVDLGMGHAYEHPFKTPEPRP